MSKRFIAALPLLALFLSNCGGGGGGGGSTLPVAPVTQQGMGSAQIKITIPNPPGSNSQSRGPKFVSAGAQGATIAAGPHGGTLATTTFDLTSGSICATVSGGRACTLNVTLPTGNDDINITLYLLAPVSGAIPNGAPILGVSNSSNVAIIPGQTASVTAYVMPTISNVTTVTPGMITVAADGVTHTGTIVLNPVDYSNNPITAGANDPYSNPITITMTETGGSGHTQLMVNNVSAGNAASITQSSQTLGVSYDGGGAPGYYATFTATATGVSSHTFNLVPMYVTSSSPYFSNGALNFTGGGETATINISEAIGFNSYTATPQTVASCPNVATVSTVAGSGATASYTVTSQNVAAATAAGCYMIVQDSATTAAARNVTVTNTTTGGTVNIGGVSEYHTPITMPENIVAGADGMLFVTGPNGANPDTVWTYDTAGAEGNWSGALDATPIATAMGPDGLLWFVAGDSNVYTWNDANNLSGDTPYNVPGSSGNVAIAEGADGNMYVVDATGRSINVVSPATHWVTSTQYSTSGAPGLITSSTFSGNVYCLMNTSGTYSIVSITPGNSTVNYRANMPAGATPAGMVADKNGNIWVSDSANGLLYEYNPIGNSWVTKISGAASAGALVFGLDGQLYFTDPSENKIGAFNIVAFSSTFYQIPTPSANPYGITLGHDGRIWFTEPGATQIGAINP